MHDVILKYLNRKLIKSKLTVSIDEYVINSLTTLVTELGPESFNRNKKLLSAQTINKTIPLMINSKITNIYENLKKIKEVRRNSLDHYKLLYGDNANEIYTTKVVKGLQTESNFIKRHGKDVGAALWNNFSKNKRKHNTLEGFQQRFGEAEGLKKFNQYCERQRYTNSIEYYIEKHGLDLGSKLFYQRYPNKDFTKNYKKYKNAVYRLSQIVYNENKNIINPNNYPRTKMGVQGGWQLDHIKPISECFNEGISIQDAADVKNLRMLPWKENLMRNFK